MNNFKELQRLQEEEYRLNLNRVQNKLENNIGFLGVFAELIDTYLSKVVDCLLDLAGGGNDPDEKK